MSSPEIVIAAQSVHAINPASPNTYYTTTRPRVLAHEVMQDFHHQ